MCSIVEQTIIIFILFVLAMHEDILDFLWYAKDILRRSEDVLEHHKYILLKFEKWLKNRGISNTKDISFPCCRDYIEWYKTTPITNWPNKWKLPRWNSIVEYVKTIRAFLSYQQKLNNTSWNIELFPALKKERWYRDCVSREEYETLRGWFICYGFNYVTAIRNQVLIDIAYHTGLRRSELLRLRFKNFENDYHQFEIIRKWGYIDPVIFSDKIKINVLLYKEMLKIDMIHRSKDYPIDYLFVWLDNRNYWKLLSKKSLDNILKDFSDKLIKDWKLNRRIHLHMFRHSFATNCVYAWLSQQAVANLMWHRSMSTTLKYFNLSNNYLQSEYKKVAEFIN